MKAQYSSFSSALFPGSGYFGAELGDPLIVQLPGLTKGLRLQLGARVEQNILNLQGISFYRGCNKIHPTIASAQQSSIYKDDPRHGPQNLLVAKGIHTKSEISPWWEVEFAEPLSATEIRIINRRDKWAKRAKSLQVLRQSKEGEWSVIYDAQSPDEYLKNILTAVRLANGRWDFRDSSPETQRQGLLNAVAEALDSDGPELSSIEWRRILALVDIWGSDVPTHDENRLLAARLFRSDGLDPLFAFSEKLKTRESIKVLQKIINNVAAARGGGSYVITRHGVQRSRLLSDTQSYLDAMHEVMAILATAGRSPMLAYGTLLGAVRDKAFIPHDDDVDILYRSEASNVSELERDLQKVQALFSDNGFEVRQCLPNYNIHVYDPGRKLIVDIFPCWNSNEMINLHMERMSVRSINREVVFPASHIDFYGYRFSVPANPEAFLAERYGGGWIAPNPFFEWPWPLEE